MNKAYLKRLLVIIPVLLLLTLLIYANIPDRPLADNVRADKIVVDKGKRKLSLIKSGEVLKSYRVSLGRQPVGQKLKEGDNKTPEGNYTIDYRNQNSCCHLALHISYPNNSDIERAGKNGINPGGELMLPGAGRIWLGGESPSNC